MAPFGGLNEVGIIVNSNRVFDLGDIRFIPRLLSDELLNDETLKKCRQALYGDHHIARPVIL
jgi:hypothetical protein